MARHIAMFGLACALASPAFAQAPPPAKPPVTPQTESNSAAACANAQATIGQGGDVQVNGPQDKAKQDKNLSDKLAKSNGVICPPDHVDPAMKQPTPPGGPMPVIPPPGTPGGDPNVQPK